MDNFFGIDSQVAETLHIMSNGWIYGFFIMGACLLAASWLVNWQVRRVRQIMAREAEKKAALERGASGGGAGEAPRV
ncbi:MAG TPA: hypothetical protein VL996_13465 [Methylocella sp.]|nr:hypothetical protein [Methylocella sp.]